MFLTDEQKARIRTIIEDSTKEIWVGGSVDTEQYPEEVIDGDKAADAVINYLTEEC